MNAKQLAEYILSSEGKEKKVYVLQEGRFYEVIEVRNQPGGIVLRVDNDYI